MFRRCSPSERLSDSLGLTEQIFYSVSKCGESFFVILCGAALFCLFRKQLKSFEKRVWDVDVLTDSLSALIGKGAMFAQRLQGGLLRGYLLTAAMTALILMLLFS